MRLTAKAFVISFFVIMVCQQSTVTAHEQNLPTRPPIVQNYPHSPSHTTLWDAIKDATFADRIVKYLDQTAVFVKEILDQAGFQTTDNK